MKRVVVTGMGIWSSIGQDLQTVTESLKQGKSGIVFDPKRIEYGLHSGLVGNVPRPDLKSLLPRKLRVTMSEDAEYAYMAACQALEQAGITDEYLRQNEVGLIFGSEGTKDSIIHAAEVMAQEKDVTALHPSMLFQSETSSVSMNLSTIFHIKGINVTISAASASSSHAIGLAATLIREGMQDTVLVGGSSTMYMKGASAYDAVWGLSTRNNSPQEACRPFDDERDGTVHSGGAAALMLEDYEHAIGRGAHILAEIVGIGVSSSGTEISAPTTVRLEVAMQRAIADAGIEADDIDYICPMAPSQIHEDECEAMVLDKVFRGKKAYVSSTESMTGHEISMAGAAKMIYTILMMQNNFIAPNINLETPSEAAKSLRIAKQTIYMPIQYAMVNASGLGGTNCCIVLKKNAKGS